MGNILTTEVDPFEHTVFGLGTNKLKGLSQSAKGDPSREKAVICLAIHRQLSDNALNNHASLMQQCSIRSGITLVGKAITPSESGSFLFPEKKHMLHWGKLYVTHHVKTYIRPNTESRQIFLQWSPPLPIFGESAGEHVFKHKKTTAQTRLVVPSLKLHPEGVPVFERVPVG